MIKSNLPAALTTLFTGEVGGQLTFAAQLTLAAVNALQGTHYSVLDEESSSDEGRAAYDQCSASWPHDQEIPLAAWSSEEDELLGGGHIGRAVVNGGPALRIYCGDFAGGPSGLTMFVVPSKD